MKAAFFREHGGPDRVEFGDLPEPAAGAGLGSMVASLVDGLITTTTFVALAGAVAAIGVWLSGDGPTATRLRTGAGVTSVSLKSFVAARPELVGAITYVGAIVIVLVGGFGFVQLVIAAALLVAGRVAVRTAQPAD